MWDKVPPILGQSLWHSHQLFHLAHGLATPKACNLKESVITEANYSQKREGGETQRGERPCPRSPSKQREDFIMKSPK